MEMISQNVPPTSTAIVGGHGYEGDDFAYKAVVGGAAVDTRHDIAESEARTRHSVHESRFQTLQSAKETDLRIADLERSVDRQFAHQNEKMAEKFAKQTEDALRARLEDEKDKRLDARFNAILDRLPTSA